MSPEFCRASVKVTGVRLSCTSSVLWELVLNGNPVGPLVSGARAPPTWATGPLSITDVDTSSQTLDCEDKVVVASGYARGEDAIIIDIDDAPPLTSSIAGVSDTYTLNVVALMSSCLVWGSLEVLEVV